MKKILITIIVLAFVSGTVFSQDKNFRFGLKSETSLNWMKPDDQKKFENDGIVAKFGYGLILEFGLGESAALSTGLEINTDGGKIAFKDSVLYFTRDDAFVERTDTAGASAYLLRSRTYRNQYITLPFILKMKTSEIGSMTYYGQFGILTSIKMRADVDDDVTNVLGEDFEQSDFDNKKDIQFLNFGLCIGAGAEMNLSGSTSFVMGINVVPGFMNIVQKKSEYLVHPDLQKVEQKANSMRIGLMLGFLF